MHLYDVRRQYVVNSQLAATCVEIHELAFTFSRQSVSNPYRPGKDVTSVQGCVDIGSLTVLQIVGRGSLPIAKDARPLVEQYGRSSSLEYLQNHLVTDVIHALDDSSE